jgi:hypothetical protein
MDNTDNIQVHQFPLKERKKKKRIKLKSYLFILPCRIFSSCIRLCNRFISFGGKSSLTSCIVYSPGQEFSTQAKRHLPSLKQTSICVRIQFLNQIYQQYKFI